MINAIVAAHARNGLWNLRGGFELPLVYAVAAVALGFTGAGKFSMDQLFGLDTSGTVAGLGALVLGLVSGLCALALRRPEPASRPQPADSQQIAV